MADGRYEIPRTQSEALEFAGKGEDFEYIRREHDAMIQEFGRVMQTLYDCTYLTPAERSEAVIDKPELSEEQFTQILVELENVTYEFDADKMIPILDELSGYIYHAKDLAKELKPVYKKVEMFDFMSAYEAVVKIKENA